MENLKEGDLIVNLNAVVQDRVYKIKSISNNGTIKAYTYDGKIWHTSTKDKCIKKIEL